MAVSSKVTKHIEAHLPKSLERKGDVETESERERERNGENDIHFQCLSLVSEMWSTLIHAHPISSHHTTPTPPLAVRQIKYLHRRHEVSACALKVCLYCLQLTEWPLSRMTIPPAHTLK